MDLEQKKALMLEISIFDQLSPEEYEVVAGRIEYIKINKGDVLIKEGSGGHTLYYLVSGSMEIRKESMDGKQALLSQFSRGSIIGEQALLETEGRRSATAVALEDCELLTLSRQNFDEMVMSHPRVGVAILRSVGKMLSERLRNTSSRVADLL
jgi:CRP-like cAMP-binding protein